MRIHNDIVITRVGSLKYLENELDDKKGYKIVNLIRDEAVLKDASPMIAGLPINLEHNESTYIGEVLSGSYSESKQAIIGDLLLYEEHDIKEVSLGYNISFVKLADGNYRILKMIPDHLALVKNGRCGYACKIN